MVTSGFLRGVVKAPVGGPEETVMSLTVPDTV